MTPSTWLRTTPPEAPIQRLEFLPVAFASPRGWPEGMKIDAVWEIASPDPFFGGYSALLVRRDGRAHAFSDLGGKLGFTLPGRGVPAPAMAPVAPHPRLAAVRQDIEAVTADPASGRIWFAYEQVHAIRRFAPDAPRGEVAQPPAMGGWEENSGAEALVRLADGRFLAFGERNRRGLLFAGDPVDGARALEFAVAWPEGYRPADAAELPDGRVLVLMRRVALGWPVFRSLLLIGDPREIADGARWRPRLLARLDGPLPRENYEALAIERDGAALILWLMSDDNFGTFQRTLLVKLHWRDWRISPVRRLPSPPS